MVWIGGLDWWFGLVVWDVNPWFLERVNPSEPQAEAIGSHSHVLFVGVCVCVCGWCVCVCARATAFLLGKKKGSGTDGLFILHRQTYVAVTSTPDMVPDLSHGQCTTSFIAVNGTTWAHVRERERGRATA